MKKKVILVVIAMGILGFVALGLFNMVAGIPVSDSYTNIKTSSPEMAQAKTIMGKKCIMCHSTEPELPFYAKLPGIGGLIAKHIEDGTHIFNLQQLLADDGKHEVLLAKLEQTINLNTMPIPPFLAMHWNGRLTSKEKADIIEWVHQARSKSYTTGLAAAQFSDNPVQPLPDRWPEALDENKVKLGNLLYHDKRLSGDDTISCASCHDLAKGGTDNAQFSTGVRDQLGGINAPTTLNSAFNVLQFWDGRAKDLADQAAGPPLNPVEMDTNWKQVIGKLSQDTELTALHASIYGKQTWSDKTITEAIAEFEKTLLTPDSNLDKYLKGQTSALTKEEQSGFSLFNEHSCVTCHAGKAMGGQSFEKPVDPVAYYKFREITPGDAEFGRFNVTKNETDRYRLKVPLLRKIALTAPYLHDGQISDLKTVIPIMHDYFVPELNRKPLSESDVDNIVAMLMKN
jgi:cytochrome c peroxidase